MLDDSGDFSELSADARRAAEREMRQRDRAEGGSDGRLLYGTLERIRLHFAARLLNS